MRTARRSVLAALLAVALGGCSHGASPLEFGGYGSTLEPQPRPAYFVVDVCSKGQPRTVTFSHVEPERVAGARQPITFRVAWPDGPRFQRVISAHEPLPAAYVPVKEARGEVGACGHPDRYAALAVVFPATRSRAITLDGLSVTYEADGDEHTAAVEVELTQCPEGTQVAADPDPEVPCSHH